MKTLTLHGLLGPMILIIGVIGCGETKRSIVPDPLVGRRVLEAAMSDWKTGRPPGMIEAEAPRIQVVDSFRKPGRTVLRSYRVLAEAADHRTRTYTVQLEFEGKDGDGIETARFLLVGIDPVLVFREQDYELLTHFEHKMDGPEISGNSVDK